MVRRFEILSTQETIKRLKNTPLRGPFEREPETKKGEKVLVYNYATLMLLKEVDTDRITPAQNYVLKEGVDRTLQLAKIFEEKGVDIFALEGALRFWTEDMSDEEEPIPLLPPMVEESIEKSGGIWLLNDGMHRVYAARKLGRPINIIIAINVPSKFPYYAYPNEKGWGGVEEIEELTEEFKKKNYREPDNYKRLFRQFNVTFPGIQEDRNKIKV